MKAVQDCHRLGKLHIRRSVVEYDMGEIATVVCSVPVMLGLRLSSICVFAFVHGTRVAESMAQSFDSALDYHQYEGTTVAFFLAFLFPR